MARRSEICAVAMFLYWRYRSGQIGDAFAARNKYAMAIDFEEQPPMFQVSETHYAATWLMHPNAPKVEPPKIVTDRIARMKEKQGERTDEQ